jgi:hypothetical protein
MVKLVHQPDQMLTDEGGLLYSSMLTAAYKGFVHLQAPARAGVCMDHFRILCCCVRLSPENTARAA